MEAKAIETDLVVVKRRYPATRQRVFDALTTADAIATWFGPNDEMSVNVLDMDPTPGGRYRIQMVHQFGNTHTVGGTYEEVVSPQRLVFSWRWEDGGMQDMGDSRVRIELEEIDGGTELILSHGGLPTEEARDGHRMGWNGGLWRLDRLFGSSTLYHDSVAFAVNRKLFTNAIKDVAQADVEKRTSPETNSLLWLAGHVAHTRGQIAQLLGAKIDSPLKIFEKPMDDDAEYPDTDAVNEYFTRATHELHASLSTTTDDTLAGPAPFNFPIADNTLGGVIAFLVQHEAYHVGQMGFVRKALGYDATEY